MRLIKYEEIGSGSIGFKRIKRPKDGVRGGT